jgi:nitrogenase molybdenum-iron protein alpha/beta subunit
MDSSEHTLTTLVRVMADMLQREQHGERFAVEIGPHAALTLVAALQQVMNERAEAAVYASAAESFLAELRRVFAAEPEVLALLEIPELADEFTGASSATIDRGES